MGPFRDGRACGFGNARKGAPDRPVPNAYKRLCNRAIGVAQNDIDRRNDDHGQQGRRCKAEQERNRKPLEDRVKQNRACADHRGKRGEQDRLESYRSRIEQHLAQRLFLARAMANEIHQKDRIAHDNAGERNKADH